MITPAGERWRQSLAGWAVPEEILKQAPESPWIHPPQLFQIPNEIADSISHRLAREAIPANGSILDIGCGGGVATFAVTPPAKVVSGVDHQQEMLDMYAANAKGRDLAATVILGFWPEVSALTPVADVVVAHHVVYNVQNIESFLLEMDSHAANRVIVEMPQRHPLSNASELWNHFWNLNRPSQPTQENLMEVLDELGLAAQVQLWDGEMRGEGDLELLAHYSRIRLCLPENREKEVLEFLQDNPIDTSRKLATIWWDKN